MIELYRYGNPFKTEATVKKIPVQPGNALPYFSVKESGRTFLLNLSKQAIIYGLGESIRGINKRGWLYISNCTDDPLHTEGKHALYAAQNFLLISDQNSFGAFFDYPGKLTFDIGYTAMDRLCVSVEEANLDLYIIHGNSLKDIVHQFRGLIGRSYIAPKWAFGYGQSRWGYCSADEICEVVHQHRKNHIPLDSIYLDIDYMDHYKDFTINEKAFPDFPEFVKKMRDQNIHLVPIVDAGVKIEQGYRVYEEGIQNNYFCKNADGTPFTGAVWPGKAHFPDMLNAKVRTWFGNQYEFLLKQGIDGFWNDMNEPALFYSEKGLEKGFQKLEEYKHQNMGLTEVADMKETVLGLANNPQDYTSFYHDCNGRMVRHDRVHNLYGYNMTRAAAEAFERFSPKKRILLFSRASAIGMHRYGGVWTGDNRSWWSHLLLAIQMMPSLNMCGFLYTGADIGGFGDDTTPDLLIRWLEFGVFTPLMRNHSAQNTRRQEVYRFPEEMSKFRNIIGIRYVLLPYLYSEYMKASLSDDLYFKPLAFDYPDDPYAARIEDQLLLGNELMLAPVYTQNAVGRTVYCPEPMMLVRMRSGREVHTERIDAGFHYVSIDMDEIVFFLRPNCIIPLSEGGESVSEVDFEKLFLLGNVQTKADYLYYDDDGCEKDYDKPEHFVKISVDNKNNAYYEGKRELQLTVLK